MGEPTNDEIMEDNSTNNWFRQPPIQRQKWGDTQVLPHVNWGDLFFDLFYVVSTEHALLYRSHGLVHEFGLFFQTNDLVSIFLFVGTFRNNY